MGRAALCVVGGVCLPWFRHSSASRALSVLSVIPPGVPFLVIIARLRVARCSSRAQMPTTAAAPPRPVSPAPHWVARSPFSVCELADGFGAHDIVPPGPTISARAGRLAPAPTRPN